MMDDPFAPRDTLPAIHTWEFTITTEDNTVPSAPALFEDDEEITRKLPRCTVRA